MSVQVLVCVPLIQADQSEHCQFGVQVVEQLSVSAGLPVVTPQKFMSEQVRVFVLFKQVLQGVQSQSGLQVEVQLFVSTGFPDDVPQEL